MRIQVNKFGTTLVSRQSGKEAYAAFLPTLREIKPDEEVELDFSGVTTFSPSWGDEFLTPLLSKFKGRVALLHVKNNVSVALIIEFLEGIKNTKFPVKS